MTTNRKNELIAQLVNILSELIETNDSDATNNSPSTVEMLTIRECTEAVKGLSEHTVRKLIKQDKLPYMRTGEGRNGKILINKADLIAYFQKKTSRTAGHCQRLLVVLNGYDKPFLCKQPRKPAVCKQNGILLKNPLDKTA